MLAGLSKATVIVTHDQLEALTMADRIAVIRDGQIEQIASLHDIFALPSNVFVAGFTGTPQMNLLNAKLIDRSADHARLEVDGQRLSLGVTQDVALDNQLTIGIRPRAFVVQNDDDLASPANQTTLKVKVELIGPMGAETLIHANGESSAYRLVVRRNQRITVGDSLTVATKDAQIHLFDRSGRRIHRGVGTA